MMEVIGKARAQVTVVVLLLTFVALMLYIAMLPTVTDFITPVADSLDQSGDHMTATMLRMFPFFLLLGILLAFLWYVMPRYG